MKSPFPNPVDVYAHCEHIDSPVEFEVLKRFPAKFVEAYRNKLIADDGKEYLDISLDTGIMAFGYCNPFINDIIHSFPFSKEPYQFPNLYRNRIRDEYGRMLLDVLGLRDGRVFYGNSGSEANENAIKIAWKYWADHNQKQKRYIVVPEGNFSGRTGLCLSANDGRDAPYWSDHFTPLSPDFLVIDDEFNVIDFTHASKQSLGKSMRPQDIIDMANDPEWQHDHVAALMMAPILGRNTVKPYSALFWNKAKAFLSNSGALFIADEIQTGMGRAGYISYSLESPAMFNIRPDIITFGKGMAAGMPMSACVGTVRVSDTLYPKINFCTVAGSPLILWVALHVLGWHKKYTKELGHVRSIGDSFRGRLSQMMSLGLLEEYEGRGLMNGFKLPERITSIPYLGRRILDEHNAIVFAAFYEKAGTIQAYAPLDSTIDEIYEICDTIEAIATMK